MLQGVHVGQQPRLHLLVARDLGPGVRTGAERGDEQRCLPHVAGIAVIDGHGGAGPVDERLLTGLVFLAQHDVEFLAPALVEFAEAAVAIAVLVGVAIFFPDQLQGHVAVTLQLLVDGGEVRRGLPGCWAWWRIRRWKQRRRQTGVVPAIRQRPTDIGGCGPFQILMHRTDGERATPCDLPLFELQFAA
jgi:hypothetical protein